MSALLELREVCFSYDTDPLINQVSFELERGDIVCLLGPSGCGKTTLQRLIAGFEQPDAGEIRLNGKCVATPTQSLPPEQRHIGMVFQDNALFPHLTVAGNIAFGLRQWTRQDRDKRVDELLSLCRLADLSASYPHEISGGQQQRVALARALAPKPELILLDEPFSGADAALRQSLADEIRQVIRAEGMTAIMVTHDQTEAFAMADCIGLMSQGRLQQWGSAQALYSSPANAFVAEFIGEGGLITGTLQADDSVSTPLGSVQISGPSQSPVDNKVRVLLRPEHLNLTASTAGNATVTQCRYQGGHFELLLELDDGQTLRASTSDENLAQAGQTVTVAVDARELMGFNTADQEQTDDR